MIFNFLKGAGWQTIYFKRNKRPAAAWPSLVWKSKEEEERRSVFLKRTIYEGCSPFLRGWLKSPIYAYAVIRLASLERKSVGLLTQINFLPTPFYLCNVATQGTGKELNWLIEYLSVFFNFFCKTCWISWKWIVGLL